ncbi:hypothetical protein PENTCL1PPCAC_27546, partial [Pristionchus entomophagus]
VMRRIAQESIRLLGTVTRRPTIVYQRRLLHPPPPAHWTTVPREAFPQAQPEPPQYPDGYPSRTEVLATLVKLGVKHETTSNKWVRTRCAECGEEDMAMISPATTHVHCTACGNSEGFSVYERKVRILKKEEKKEDGRSQEEESKIVEETVSSTMDSAAMDDVDMYDRVSYLDLVNQHEKQLFRKREDRTERLRRIMDGAETLSPRDALDTVDSRAERSLPMPVDANIKYFWDGSTAIAEVDREEKVELLELCMMLGIENISTDTLSRFNVRVHMSSYDHPALVYPRYRGPVSRGRLPHGLKLIRRIKDKLEKENYPLDEPRFTGMFGLHMATLADRKVVVTTNERDALAVYEACGMLTVSLPKGELVDEQVIPYLEDFETIYLWFPHRHLDFARDYAALLNANRCYLIKNSDRPIELLRHNRSREIPLIIQEEAIQVRSRGFRSMIDVREDIKQEIINSKPRLQGMAQWKRFDALNRYLVGFRSGELTVLTGATGVGKTTFLCEYALDLFSQGVRTLFCSFEMSDEHILRWMLVQYAGLPLHRVENHHLVEEWLDRFERTKGSLTLMKKHEFRDKSIKEIFEAIKNHVISNGTQHVVIDNLQFLVGMSLVNDDGATSIDRYNAQDRLVGMLRRLATDYGVHVTLVVHPRKTDSDADLDVQHFGGSARVTQEADNVIAIQKRRDDVTRKPRKFLYILKNRYTGRILTHDALEMIFQPATYSHTLNDLSK